MLITPTDVSDTIISIVCNHYDVPRRRIFEKNRHKAVKTARMVAMWLHRRLTPMSYPEIGERLERDHSTVIYGVEMIERRRVEEADLMATLPRLARLVAAALDVSVQDRVLH